MLSSISGTSSTLNQLAKVCQIVGEESLPQTTSRTRLASLPGSDRTRKDSKPSTTAFEEHTSLSSIQTTSQGRIMFQTLRYDTQNDNGQLVQHDAGLSLKRSSACERCRSKKVARLLNYIADQADRKTAALYRSKGEL